MTEAENHRRHREDTENTEGGRVGALKDEGKWRLAIQMPLLVPSAPKNPRLSAISRVHPRAVFQRLNSYSNFCLYPHPAPFLFPLPERRRRARGDRIYMGRLWARVRRLFLSKRESGVSRGLQQCP